MFPDGSNSSSRSRPADRTDSLATMSVTTNSVTTNNVICLDNAATSFPKPESVYSAVDRWMRRAGIAFGRGQHAGTLSAERMVTETRHNIALLLNAGSADRMAFSLNCTDSLHLLLRGLIQHNDTVLTTTLDHNSVIRPLHQLVGEKNVSVHRTGFNPRTGVVDVDEFESCLQTHQPRIVALNHASNVTGVIQPIKHLTRLAHQHGAFVILDAAQTVGHIPVDLQDLDVDYMAAAGHKGLLGPLGTGIVYVANDREHQLVPVRTGGSGQHSEDPEHPTQMPGRLESGNLNVPGIAGLHASTEWLLSESVEAVQQQVHRLEQKLVMGLQQIDKITVYCRPTGQTSAEQTSIAATSVVSFSIPGMDSREVSVILDQSFGIQSRSGLHCAPLVHQTLGTTPNGGTVRLSPGPFTTTTEVDFTLDAIRQIAESMSFA